MPTIAFFEGKPLLSGMAYEVTWRDITYLPIAREPAPQDDESADDDEDVDADDHSV